MFIERNKIKASQEKDKPVSVAEQVQIEKEALPNSTIANNFISSSLI